jgi:hypothetical protein
MALCGLWLQRKNMGMTPSDFQNMITLLLLVITMLTQGMNITKILQLFRSLRDTMPINYSLYQHMAT